MAKWPSAGDRPASGLHDRKREDRHRRARLAFGVAALSLLAVLGAAVSVVLIVIGHLTGDITRIPQAFQGINPATRPIVPAAYRGSMTILVAASDIRSQVPTTGSGRRQILVPGAQRSDALMLVHIDADRRHISVISIPRDSWVPVPGHGSMKINAALSLGGPPLMIRTVEQLTGVLINHYAVTDFGGFEAMVQALGGVQVGVAAPTSSRGVFFRRGINDLGPSQALVYVRQRYGLPGGDLSRIQRQQSLIRAILAKIATEHVLTDPIALYCLLNAITRSVSVDSTFTNADMRSLAVQLTGLQGGDLTFLTAPVRALGWADRQSVVLLDLAKCAGLWTAVRHDAVAGWARRHPGTLTPGTPY